MANVLLSLDVSTTTIGIAVFKYKSFNDKKLIYFDYYKPNQTKKPLSNLTNEQKLDIITTTRNHILCLARKYKITEFAIEDYIQFMQGKSAAATVIPLAILNMTLRLAILDNLEIKPIALNVVKIRHAIKKTKKAPKKEDVPGLVAEHLGLKEFPWYTKINRRTKQEEIMEESYDVADGIAVGLAYIKLVESGQNLDPQKKSKKRKKKKVKNNGSARSV